MKILWTLRGKPLHIFIESCWGSRNGQESWTASDQKGGNFKYGGNPIPNFISRSEFGWVIVTGNSETENVRHKYILVGLTPISQYNRIQKECARPRTQPDCGRWAKKYPLFQRRLLFTELRTSLPVRFHYRHIHGGCAWTL